MRQQVAVAPAGRGHVPRAAPRVVQRERSDRVVAIGLRDPWMGDLYHHLLTLPWSTFLLGLAAVYLGLNVVFALLYQLGDGAISNARPGVFVDAFFFSVETLSTIGYGQMSPATLYGNIVMTVEAMFGLGLIAVAAGLMFARFSRPTARVMFSKVAVVTEHNGVPTLSLRLANERRKSDPRGPGLPRTGSRRAHYRGRMDPPILRSATGAPTEFDLRDDLHRHASDRLDESVIG